MTEQVKFEDLERQLSILDLSSRDCKEKIATFRRVADAACDNKSITLKQWRELVMRLAPIQEKCLQLHPDAWRRPVSNR